MSSRIDGDLYIVGEDHPFAIAFSKVLGEAGRPGKVTQMTFHDPSELLLSFRVRDSRGRLIEYGTHTVIEDGESSTVDPTSPAWRSPPSE